MWCFLGYAKFISHICVFSHQWSVWYDRWYHTVRSVLTLIVRVFIEQLFYSVIWLDDTTLILHILLSLFEKVFNKNEREWTMLLLVKSRAYTVYDCDLWPADITPRAIMPHFNYMTMCYGYLCEKSILTFDLIN